MYKRIVIKLSGEALANKTKSGNDTNSMFHDETINNIITDIKKVVKAGTQVSLAVGGGNIWRGRTADSKMDRCKADEVGMLATVMNGLYLADMFNQHGVKAVVMTPFIVGSMTDLFSKDKAISYMEDDKVLIFAGGLGHPFFSTDTIPALRAAELEADCVLFAKSIDGVYDKNPAVHEDAVRYKEITYRKIIKDNLVVNDLAAMVLCEDNNIPSLVFSLNHPNSIEIASQNNEKFYEFGTKVIFNPEEDYYVK